MKTLLYNPIYINPQAYDVFPRLTKYLQPDNESTLEPANYIGTIEVKVISCGDTSLVKTYINTDSIDLIEFKNTWIRISLFTKVGSCILGEWKIGNMESDLPYIDPEVLASLKAVVIVDGKTNNDSDRAIVKNLIDSDNPFVISNAAYTEGSGYADKGSSYYGAFVTDGIDDLITSTKTVQETLGGSTEFTVVSMIHLISLGQDVGGTAYTNYIRTSDNYWTTNRVSNTDKTGIYGYSFKQGTPTAINNILGDKNDYTAEKSDIVSDGSVSELFNTKFSVEGFEHVINGAVHVSSVAWYWTFIANKVLTTDQINQVIAYYNLDRTLKPDIYCDTVKQGITNDNHADFDDKLIDYSDNGRDIQLYNIGWYGDSGIGRYPSKLGMFRYDGSAIINTRTKIEIILNPPENIGYTYLAIPSFEVKLSNLPENGYATYTYTNSEQELELILDKNTTYILPASEESSSGASFLLHDPYNIDYIGFTIEEIELNKGALCLDGVNDFGKVTGMPIYKDYTFIAEREIISIPDLATTGSLVSKAYEPEKGAFIIEDITKNRTIETSFSKENYITNYNAGRSISYQSKYSYNSNALEVGQAEDRDVMWLGTIRDNDTRFANVAIYSLMSFPYSMSEFLIERQLKKYKLGTLYPNMVEFRPVINKDDRIKNVKYYKLNGIANYIDLNIGNYIPVGQRVAIVVDLEEPYKISGINSSSLTDVEIKRSGGQNYAYDILGFITDESPQKITVTIQ